MRLALALLFLGVAYAQPVEMTFPICYKGASGPGGCQSNGIRYNDNTTGNYLYGDTYHFTAHAASGNWYGTCNDCTYNQAGGVGINNLQIYKMTALDLTTPNNTLVTKISDTTFDNAYTIQGSSLLSAPNCGGGNCSIKSYDPFMVKGCYYQFVFLQAGSWPSSSHATIIKSCNMDSGSTPTWVNPAHAAGVPALNGDPPVWNTASPGSDILFPATAGAPNKIGNAIIPIISANYQDNGSTCPVIPTSIGGDGAGTYFYFFSQASDWSGLYGPFRWLCANIQNLSTSDIQAWDGTTWTSTLANAHLAAYNSPFYPNGSNASHAGGYPGTAYATGTSVSITYLPDFNRLVMVGQICHDCQNEYNPDLLMAQAGSLTGTWTVDPMAKRWGGPSTGNGPGPYQYGTNPRNRRLNGAIISTTTDLVMQNTADGTTYNALNYDSTYDPDIFPFNITIDTEVISICFASTTHMYVGTTSGSSSACQSTSGRNQPGSTGGAASHADKTEVMAPFRLRPQLSAFVPGTYSYSNGVATMTIAAEGNAFNFSNTADNKTRNVYGLYFFQVQFANLPQGSFMRGNVPLRFTTSVSQVTMPARGLIQLWDMWDGAGATGGFATGTPSGAGGTNTVVHPLEPITGDTCNPTGVNSNSQIGWNANGLYFSGNASGNADLRCISQQNSPVTGTQAFTIMFVAKPNAVGTTYDCPVVFGAASAGHGIGLCSMANAGLWGYNAGGGSGINTGANAWTANVWNVMTLTQTSSGDLATGGTLYVNGVPNCGKNATSACTTGAPTTINITAGPIWFGSSYLFSGISNWWNGTIGGFYVWNRELSRAEVLQAYKALKKAYAVNRGIALP